MSYDVAEIPGTPPPPRPDSIPKPVAPWLHTVGLFALLGLTTLLTRHRAATRDLAEIRHIPSYLASIGMEWLLLALVLAGLHRKREFLLQAFRSRAHTLLESIGLGAVVYILGFMAIAITGAILYLTPLFPKRNEAVVLAMAPRTVAEFVAWFGVSLTAGLCEELIFRGYLLQQLTAWTRRPVTSIFLAALLFGSVHLYEGVGAILPLAALAVVYGFVVRHFKGDLRAVVVAHTLQDFLVAFLVLAKPYLERFQQTH
jgi:membrane protease YdiL (CAAX protease family)